MPAAVGLPRKPMRRALPRKPEWHSLLFSLPWCQRVAMISSLGSPDRALGRGFVFPFHGQSRSLRRLGAVGPARPSSEPRVDFVFVPTNGVRTELHRSWEGARPNVTPPLHSRSLGAVFHHWVSKNSTARLLAFYLVHLASPICGAIRRNS